MKKVVIAIIIFVIIFVSVWGVYVHLRTDKAKIEAYEEQLDSMKITMIGGSNMEDKGKLNSCGYVIRTKHGELIVVDGGRDVDADIIFDYIQKWGNGTVNHWFITHPHADHVGALVKLIEEKDITIENVYYSFNSLEWYKQYDERGFETEEKMIHSLESPKFKNKIACTKNQNIMMDNVQCEILRIANPEITNSDNGNDSSMVFKMTAIDVNKSILFLGDAFYYTSKELLENPEKLKADVVQMAHHGQNGVSKEVYEAIKPEVCCFNAPEWLYNNDNGTGYNTGTWLSIEVRDWMQQMGAKNIVAYQGDRTICFTKNGIEL